MVPQTTSFTMNSVTVKSVKNLLLLNLINVKIGVCIQTAALRGELV